jgi:ferredoxin--NADP+ reductase
MYTVDADFVVRSVGYRGTALDEVPFDSGKNVIPSVDGRVQRDGVTVPGEYVAGWIKRGPTGIIGTNKKCAVGTVASLIEDVSANLLPAASHGTIEEFDARIAAVETVDTAGWRSIDKAERALGESAGRARTSIHTADGMLSAAKA